MEKEEAAKEVISSSSAEDEGSVAPVYSLGLNTPASEESLLSSTSGGGSSVPEGENSDVAETTTEEESPSAGEDSSTTGSQINLKEDEDQKMQEQGLLSRISRIPRAIISRRSEAAQGFLAGSPFKVEKLVKESIPISGDEASRHSKSLELRYKMQYKKYHQYINDMVELNTRFLRSKKILRSLRTQIIERLGSDPGDVPRLKLNTDPEELSAQEEIVSKQKKKISKLKQRNKYLEDESITLADKLNSLHGFYEIQINYIKDLKIELPQLELQYKEISGQVELAETRQNTLDERILEDEKRLEEMATIINQATIQKNKCEQAMRKMESKVSKLQLENCELMHLQAEQQSELKTLSITINTEHEARLEAERLLEEAHKETMSLENKYNEVISKLDNALSQIEKVDSFVEPEKFEALKRFAEDKELVAQKLQEQFDLLERSKKELDSKLEKQESMLVNQQKQLLEATNCRSAQEMTTNELQSQVASVKSLLMREGRAKEELEKQLGTKQLEFEETLRKKLVEMDSILAKMMEEKNEKEKELEWSKRVSEQLEAKCRDLEDALIDKDNLLEYLRKEMETTKKEEEDLNIGIATDLVVKSEELRSLERKVEMLEKSRDRCSRITTLYEARMACLEACLAHVSVP